MSSNHYKMMDWEQAIISVQLYRNYKNMSSNLKCNVNELWTRPAAYIWKWDEDNGGDDEDDNMFTRASITALFAEATKRGNQHFQYIIK